MQLITTVHRAHQAIKDICLKTLTDKEVTPTQLVVLMALAEHEYNTQRELIAATGIDRSTMTDVLARLGRKGLVVRKTLRRDARAKTPRITHQGRMVVVRSAVAIPRIEAELVARMPELRSLRQQVRQVGKMKKAA